jgi:PKD repeat protein
MKLFKSITVTFLLPLLLISCKKYQEIRPSNFSDQQIYMPAAVAGNSVNGIYRVNAVAVPGQVFRYVADVAGGRLNIPLAVYRSGANSNANIQVTITPNTDTVNKLILANGFPAPTELLPSSRYTLVNSVTIDDGQSYKGFNLSLDLNFLLANLTKDYAIGIGVSSTQVASAPASTTVVFIDPAFLVPTANFTRTISGRTVSFANTSLNTNAWSWNYGDGSAVSTLSAAPYTYANPGTYTITLTARGALGSFNPSTFTSVVVIP